MTKPETVQRPSAAARPARPAAPRYWGVWAGMGVVRVLSLLPYGLQMAIGRGLGRLAWRFARRERAVGEVNLALCFPERPPSERDTLLRKHFESLGCALFDTALAWWAPRRRIEDLTALDGAEHLDAALQGGRGALLFCAHFAAAEMGARALGVRMPLSVMYQTPRNPVLAYQFVTSRASREVQLIPSDNVRDLLRALKANRPVWFAADQREDMRSCTLAPFFGIPVVSNTAPSRIARISGAPVLPYFIERLDRGGYRMRIGPALADFPSADEVDDATRLHALVEADVRHRPEQYLLTYKRFKRPGPDGDPYEPAPAPGNPAHGPQ